MNKFKILIMVGLCLFSVITSSKVYAESNDTFSFQTWLSDMVDRVNAGIQNIQDRLAGISSSQEHLKQVAADSLQKEKQAIEDAKMREEDGEVRAQDLKEQQEAQKQQQKDLMQILSDRQTK
jgi:hypothetical protein